MTDSYEMLMCVAALNGLGVLLKNNPRVPNAWIPTILALAGACLLPILSETWSATNVINGFLAGNAAVGAHQIVSTIRNGKTKPNETKPPSVPVLPSTV